MATEKRRSSSLLTLFGGVPEYISGDENDATKSGAIAALESPYSPDCAKYSESSGAGVEVTIEDAGDAADISHLLTSAIETLVDKKFEPLELLIRNIELKLSQNLEADKVNSKN